MLYDFKCPHGHMFEHTCKMDDRNIPIPGEGIINQLVDDEVFEKYSDSHEPLPDGLFWTTLGREEEVDGETKVIEDDVQIEQVLMRKVTCQLMAQIFTGTHNNIRGMLDHGLGSNRDAAREGRYNPLSPNTRFMAKGRGWRK